MQYKNHRGEWTKWKIQSRNSGFTSRGHLKTRELLNELFVNRTIYEEVIIPNTRLSIDFLIPCVPLAIEVQGAQHTEHIPHFHGKRYNFIKQIQRDNKKKEWLSNNNIPLIELYDKDNIDVWRETIINFFREANQSRPKN